MPPIVFLRAYFTDDAAALIMAAGVDPLALAYLVVVIQGWPAAIDRVQALTMIDRFVLADRSRSTGDL